MPAAKRGVEARRRTTQSRREAGPDRTVPRHYIVYRASTEADGTARIQYEVPGLPGPVNEAGFTAWCHANVPSGKENSHIAVLVIREVLDRHGSILTCVLERRRGSATGPFHGEPARVTFAGAGEQVRLYHASGATLREIVPSMDQRPPPVARRDHFSGEETTIRGLFGPATQILDARGPTLLEELVGLTSIVHVRAPSGVEIDCGLGWHGTTPFVLRADFPRFDASPALPPTEAATIAVAAVAAGLATYEARTDAEGPVVLARSARDGTLHLIRPDGGGVRIDAYAPGVPPALLNPDQARWLRYAEAHERLAILDAYPDGRADGVFILAAAPSGEVLRHLIDADGVEVWRAAADDTLVALLHREGQRGER